MKNTSKVFAILMAAIMILSLASTAAFAEDDNTYTLYDGFGGSVYAAAQDYDASAPVMLDTSITKSGYTFTGWYTEDTSGEYVAETDSETKYYEVTTTEKSTTSPDFTSDTEYFTKVEMYKPVLLNGTNFRRQNVAVGASPMEGTYISAYGTVKTKVKPSNVAVGSIVYLDTYNYYASYKGTIAALDALLPSGYTGSDWGVYSPIAVTEELKSELLTKMNVEQYASPFITADFESGMTTVSNRAMWYALYEKDSTSSPVTAATYTAGTTVYYNETAKTEIDPADYDPSNPAHTEETVQTPTGAFAKKTGSEPAGTKTYALANMTPSSDLGDVSYYAGWTDEDVSTYVLDDGCGSVSVPVAYDAASPVTLPTPQRNGYSFAGWLDENSNTVTTTPSVDAGDVIYTATWSYASYIESMTITKTYDRTFDTAATAIPTQDVFEETISYTITPVRSENRLVGKTAIPEITSENITVGDGDDTATVYFPDFNAPEYGIGDYWYKVVETAGTTAGVTYDVREYYLHLVVTNEDGDGVTCGVSSYGLHESTEDGTKVGGFTNVYNAGELSVNKQVTGNMGDPDMLFKVTVTFTAPEGKTVMGDISYEGGYADEAGATAYTSAAPGVIAANWTGTKTVDIYLKDDATVTFSNIPEGVTYTVAEADYSADGYTASYAVDSTETADGDTAGDANVSGTITDESDAVTITNDKSIAVDVGVIVNSAPFVIILIGAAAFIAAVLLRKRRRVFDAE